MINLLIKNTTTYKLPFTKLFKEVAIKMIKNEAIIGNTELSLIIVADSKIKSLAKKYKNKNYVTDVLSFSNDWKKLNKITNSNILGDIYINKNKVISQAKKYRHSIKREFIYLFLHGLLHLLGYDHIDQASEKVMDNKIEAVLTEMEVKK